MACEVTFGSFRNTLTTPCDQGKLGKASIGIFDPHKSELNATITELIYQIDKFSLCENVSACLDQDRMYTPPLLCTLRTLSLLPESCWKAFAKGAVTEKTAHCP